jgi:hypothetical protein
VTDQNGAQAELAARIASQGREALVERLRKAYADAAAAHADIVSLDEQRIEALVQSAADRADGLQWRRALASVASQELGISLAQALTHPAVSEAQEQLGAPSYEASLSELVARPLPPAVVPAPVTPEPTPVQEERRPAAPEPIEQDPGPAPVQPEWAIEEPEVHGATGELETVEADNAVFELLPPPEPFEDEADSYEALPDEVEEPAPPVLEQVPYEPEAQEPAVAGPPEGEPAHTEPEPAADGEYVGEPTQAHALDDAVPTYGSEHTDYPPAQDDTLQVLAYHLGGVANLPTGRAGLDLRLSEHGLDILQPEGEIIGRLHWNEIDTLEVVAVRGRLRRQARTLSRIVVRTKHGDASFEIPGLSSDELEARIKPLVSRYAGG